MTLYTLVSIDRSGFSIISPFYFL